MMKRNKIKVSLYNKGKEIAKHSQRLLKKKWEENIKRFEQVIETLSKDTIFLSLKKSLGDVYMKIIL